MTEKVPRKPREISSSDIVTAYRKLFEVDPKRVNLTTVAIELGTYSMLVKRRFGSLEALHRAAYPPTDLRPIEITEGEPEGKPSADVDKWPLRPRRGAPPEEVLRYAEDVLLAKNIEYADKHVGDLDAARCVDVIASAIVKLRRVNGTSLEKTDVVAAAKASLNVVEYEIALPKLAEVTGKDGGPPPSPPVNAWPAKPATA